jgi:hypothetical protein
MRERSFSVTALAFSSVMVALYCQVAAIGLMLTGAAFSPSGSVHAAVAFANGALFFGLAVAAWFVAYGLWTRKHWSWAGAISLFGVLVVLNLIASTAASSYISSLVPAAAATICVWHLLRAPIKAELLGTEVPVRATARVPEALEAAGGAR